jgi:hypothetical protein
MTDYLLIFSFSETLMQRLTISPIHIKSFEELLYYPNINGFTKAYLILCISKRAADSIMIIN